MTFPPGPPGQQAPPPWDPRTASRPFKFPSGAGPYFASGMPPTGQGAPGPFPGQPLPGRQLPGQPMPGQPLPGPVPGAPAGQPWPSGPLSGPPAGPARSPERWVVALRIAGLLLVALGLSIPFDSSCDWAARTTWSIFAIVAAVVPLLSSAGGSFGWDVRRSWLIGAVATGALTLHWLLIALPNIGSNAGFCLTFGTAAAIGGMLLAPGRRW